MSNKAKTCLNCKHHERDRTCQRIEGLIDIFVFKNLVTDSEPEVDHIKTPFDFGCVGFECKK